MKLSQFKFDLPKEQIAQHPLRYRDDARLLVLHRTTGQIEHKLVPELVQFFNDGDLFLFNDARVFPARLYATKEKTNARIEVFLLRELNHQSRYWDVLVDPARKIRIGNKLYFGNDDSIEAEVIDNTTSRGRTLRFLSDYDNDEFVERLYALGETPLPKYIERKWENNETDEEARKRRDEEMKEMRAEDAERYQSVFATKIGAVAAPASSIHFSRNTLKRMEIHGIDYVFMTSYVNLCNFKPIDVEDLTKHKMDSEQFVIPQEVADAVDKAHDNGKHVCAVGTEIMRAIESIAGTRGQITAYNGWTNKFIFPPYDFSVADSFFCNLYLPQSAQLMMVASFAGYEYTMAAYREAVKEGYRFGDYGDAMLVVD